MSDDELDFKVTIKKKLKTDGPADDTKMDAEEEKTNGNKESKVENGGKDEEEPKVFKNSFWDEDEKGIAENTKLEEQANPAFYDKKGNLEQYERRNLETIDLRSYHNWIKSVLINKYVNRVKNDYQDRHRNQLRVCVMDLGCGNGGDLNKWLRAFIGYYVGVDVSKTAVENAHERWKDIKRSKFQADFISVGGALREDKFFKNINENVYFDLISSQFCIHYMFSKEIYVHRLFNNISKRLVKNGYFVCTIPDADVLVKRIRTKGVRNENGETIIGNKYYSIRFKQEKFPKDSPYGIEYGFFLDDSAVGSKEVDENGNVKITYVSEYLIIPENMRKVAKKYDLEVVEESNFHDFCKESIKNKFYAELLNILKIEDVGKIDPKLWEISYLYKVMVFKKTSGKEMSEVDRRFGKYAKGTVVLQNDLAEDDADDIIEEGEVGEDRDVDLDEDLDRDLDRDLDEDKEEDKEEDKKVAELSDDLFEDDT